MHCSRAAASADCSLSPEHFKFWPSLWLGQTTLASYRTEREGGRGGEVEKRVSREGGEAHGFEIGRRWSDGDLDGREGPRYEMDRDLKLFGFTGDWVSAEA